MPAAREDGGLSRGAVGLPVSVRVHNSRNIRPFPRMKQKDNVPAKVTWQLWLNVDVEHGEIHS